VGTRRLLVQALLLLSLAACSGAGGGGTGTLTLTIEGKAYAFDGVSCSVGANSSNLTVEVGDESAGDYVRLEAGSRGAGAGASGALSGGGTFHDYGLLGRQGETTFGLDPDTKLTIDLPSDLRSGKFSGGVRFGTVGHHLARGTMTGSFAC
jgi:hypothetical protein